MSSPSNALAEGKSAPADSWSTRRKDVIGVWKDIATVIALVVGGWWTWNVTHVFRETEPHLEVHSDVSSWVLRDGSLLIRIDAALRNTSKVLIKGVAGRIIVIRLLPESDAQAADYAKGKLLYPCPDARAHPGVHCVPEQGLNVPSGARAVLDIDEPEKTIEPGETERVWRYLRLDKLAKVLEVSTIIDRPGSTHEGWLDEATHNLRPVSLAP